MSKNSLGFAPVLIVVILGAIGIIGYLILAQSTKQTPTTPLPEPTQESPDNWKTYTNSGYGYSIKYPSNLSPEKSDNDIYLSFVSFGSLSDEQNPSFSISVRETNLEDEVESVKWQSSHSLVTLVKEENMTINGYPAARLDYEPQSPDVGPSDTFIIINKEGFSYTIHSRTETIDQILSTFKFLE